MGYLETAKEKSFFSALMRTLTILFTAQNMKPFPDKAEKDIFSLITADEYASQFILVCASL